jgi:prepilin peptidase dependent protein B
MLTPHPPCRRSGQRGLSIVELLVGVVVGLFVVGGAVKLMVDNLTNNRRMLVETRVNQDLRAAADLIARDLRRAGYWQNSAAGVCSDFACTAVVNQYSPVSYDVGTGVLSYRYAKDSDNSFTAGSVEDFGVQRAVVNGVGVIQLRTAGAWQTITDPGTLDIPSVADLSIVPSASRTVELWDACPCRSALTCTDGQFQLVDPLTTVQGIFYLTRPRMEIRQYTLVLSGRAVSDNRIRRQITETVRVRNDEVAGTCP